MFFAVSIAVGMSKIIRSIRHETKLNKQVHTYKNQKKLTMELAILKDTHYTHMGVWKFSMVF